ncbi:LysR substrate-binding domain-containing protein [Bordetella sp. 2513F-2]
MQPSQLPLTALRAFEASARHLSFKAAAAELHVTPTAISHQIQALERMLGVELFVRLHRGLALTPAAEACLQPLRDGFGALCRVVETLRQYQDDGRLSVSAPPSFTMRLLMPVTHQFLALHPEIDLHIATRMREPGHIGRRPAEEAETLRAWAESSDVVIVYGGGVCPGLEGEELLRLSITLLCSPALLRGPAPLREPADVARFPWLHDERGSKYGGTSFWRLWLDAAGLDLPDAGAGSRYTHAALAIDAAVRGRGLVVTTPALCRAELDAGLLVAPFDLRVALDHSYHLVHRPTSRPAVLQFKQWLRETLAPDRLD